MYRQIMGWIAVLVLATGMAHAATLEIPTPHTALSGIGVISGWKCDAGELTVRFNGGAPLPLVYGSERTDVLREGACDHAEVGFVSIMNWGELGDGQHTAVVYDDGIEFDRSTFHVVTTGEAFLVGAAGQCVVSDFPAPNENARFIWNQPTQHLELAEVGGAELLPLVEECEETTCPVCEVCRECPPGTSSTPFDGIWDVDLTLTQDVHGACTLAAEGDSLGAKFYISNHQVLPVGIPEWWGTWEWVSHSGAVTASGVVAVTMIRGWDNPESAQGTSAFSGRLSGRRGSGTWFSVTGCSAQWTATKVSDDPGR